MTFYFTMHITYGLTILVSHNYNFTIWDFLLTFYNVFNNLNMLCYWMYSTKYIQKYLTRLHILLCALAAARLDDAAFHTAVAWRSSGSMNWGQQFSAFWNNKTNMHRYYQFIIILIALFIFFLIFWLPTSLHWLCF